MSVQHATLIIHTKSNSVMPGFHHSVAVSPFCCTIAILPFRSYRCRCGWERKCWKRLSV